MQYQSEGVKTVEMEIAALFALGQFRNVQVASAVAVGDSLAHLRWDLPDNLRVIQRSLEYIYISAIDVLSE
jgi:purine-nucleoside phosphorylase